MELVMPKSTYNAIVDDFNHWQENMRALVNFICLKYSLPLKTANSIVSNNFVRRIKETHFRLSSQSKTIWKEYNNEVLEGREPGIILRIACKMRSSPTLVAKIILDQYLKASHGSPSKQQAEQAEEPCERVKIPGEGRNTSSRMLRDTSLIMDGRLASEVLLCDLSDDQYGLLSEMYNRGIGEEFENILNLKAREYGLSYEAEEHLRSRGYDKTPDLKLNVPIAVDGFVVNWIESKGLFGDYLGHRAYISEQYSSYWNRFGPGLVIYWLGYEDSIADPHERKFIVRAGFPTNITLMDQLSTQISTERQDLSTSSILYGVSS